MRIFRLIMIAAALARGTSVMAGDIAPGGTLRAIYLGSNPAQAMRAVFVVAERECPHPGLSNWRCVHLENAADHNAVGKYVIVIIVPFAGWARS